MMNFHAWAIKWNVSFDALQDLMNMFATEERPADGMQDEIEAEVQQQIRVYAGTIGGVMWRNNSGTFMNPNDRLVRFGLGNDSAKLNKKYKSPDLVGLTRLTGGVLILCEVKRPGWTGPKTEHEVAQAAFLTHAASFGAKAGFATSVNDFKKIVGVL